MGMDYGCYKLIAIKPEVLKEMFPNEMDALIKAWGDEDWDEFGRYYASEWEEDDLDTVRDDPDAARNAFETLSLAFAERFPGLTLDFQYVPENMDNGPDTVEGGVFCIYGAYTLTHAARELLSAGKIVEKSVIWWG